MRSAVARNRQRGAFIITTALLLLLLLGFMGIAIDFGRLFVVKTELQTAMDSCALAAAHELDGQGTAGSPNNALSRARNAGTTAGNLNRVNMQSANWSGQGQIDINADITFRDAAYAITASPASARYAQCQHTQSNLAILLMQIIGLVNGDTAGNPNTRSVWASAVATRGSAQTTCPLPVALHPKKPGDGPPNYGYVVGEWIPLLHNQPTDPGGKIGWASLDPDAPVNSANGIRDQLNGYCGTRVGDPLRPIESNGTMSALVEPWNYRFGIYKKMPNFATDPGYVRPDMSGFSYTEENWTNPFPQNAYSGVASAGSVNFVNARNATAPCATSVKNCEDTINRRLNSYKDIASAAQHGQYGSNRRIVTVPVVNSDSTVRDYACMLMLHPLSIPFNIAEEVKLEFLGNAGVVDSPCATGGLPGGTAGPLVPVLVR